jgi:nonsense-mediated mRNA decay protein 3
MTSGKFCYLCGKITDALYGGLCSSCYLKDKKLFFLPENIEVSVCRGCMRYYAGAWVEGENPLSALVDAVVQKEVERRLSKDLENLGTKVEIIDIKEKGKGLTVVLEVNVTGSTMGLDYHAVQKSTLVIKNVVCPDCSKRAGGYYEAVVQLRAESIDGPLSELHSQLNRIYEKDKHAFMVEEAVVKGGVDIKLGSTKAAKTLGAYFKAHHKAEIKETAKLMGKKDGNDIYRRTVLIRI